MDQFLLFGDSITQQSFAQTSGFAFGAALTDAYVRKLDVVNRGFSGYNTVQALQVLDKVIPPPSQANLRFLTVFLGANDARLPNTLGPAQTVTLDEYKKNLRAILTHPSIKAHKDVRIIVITAPPVEERTHFHDDRRNYPELKASRRTADNTAAYAQGARDVAASLGVSVLDLWTAMMKRAGWKSQEDGPLPGSSDIEQNKVLVSLLHDGLHFSPDGYKVLFDELMALIKSKYSDQMPDKLPFVLPAWDDPQAWK